MSNVSPDNVTPRVQIVIPVPNERNPGATFAPVTAPDGGGLASPSLDAQLENASGSFGSLQILALFTFILFYIAEGMELVVTNITWNVLPRAEWGIAPDQDYLRGVLVSATFFGYALGALFGGVTGDFLGRRPIILLHSILFIIGSIVSALAQGYDVLLASRFLVGAGVGMMAPTALSLMTELSTVSNRGRSILIIPGTAYAIGQVAVLLLGISLISAYGYDCRDCQWWRWMMVIGVVPNTIATVLFYLYIPESPRYLLVHGRMEEVAAVIRRISVFNGREDQIKNYGHCEPLFEDEMTRDFFESSMELFQYPLVKLVPLLVVTWCFISVSIFAQAFMWPIFLERLSFSHLEQYWLMVLVAGLEIPAMIIYTAYSLEIPAMIVIILIIDIPSAGGSSKFWISRRLLVLCLTILLGSWLVLHILMRHSSAAWMVIGNIGLRIFSVFPYKTMYVYVSESLPTSHRNAGLSLGNASTKMVAGVLPLFLQPLMSADDEPYYLVFLCICIGGFLLWIGSDTDRYLADTTAQLYEGYLPILTPNPSADDDEPRQGAKTPNSSTSPTASGRNSPINVTPRPRTALRGGRWLENVTDPAHKSR